jgi:hypothetical protein
MKKITTLTINNIMAFHTNMNYKFHSKFLTLTVIT